MKVIIAIITIVILTLVTLYLFNSEYKVSNSQSAIPDFEFRTCIQHKVNKITYFIKAKDKFKLEVRLMDNFHGGGNTPNSSTEDMKIHHFQFKNYVSVPCPKITN